MLEHLLQSYKQGGRRALSRLLTLAARGESADELVAALPSPAKPSRVIAITGSGGVGKSTLIGKLIEISRRENQTIAVLACDPQSPRTGGALLGDRFRMPARSDDDGVFIRSLAAESGHGALAKNLSTMVRLLESFGFDNVIVETVGAGQGDTSVQELAHVIVLLLQPETGDDLQWEKAGILEVADIIVIQKSDLPRAEQVEAQVRASVALSSAPTTVLRVSARTGEGVEALWNAITVRPLRRKTQPSCDRSLLKLAHESLDKWYSAASDGKDEGLAQLLQRWRQGTISKESTLKELLQLWLKENRPR
jgi:LAO/AO transport system ATPase